MDYDVPHLWNVVTHYAQPASPGSPGVKVDAIAIGDKPVDMGDARFFLGGIADSVVAAATNGKPYVTAVNEYSGLNSHGFLVLVLLVFCFLLRCESVRNNTVVIICKTN
ncbi:hypothetical protein H6P81_004901 [Aristolochia fimbriata]|uniref:Uncharacterized protein n=1 Tax=Aristolochia fimbriata TaxID=158543 RepID=A0AAV7EWI2_ARIFI|nr:hypothetical protein H6P81_004901 [Aristolochia fimbriata]